MASERFVRRSWRSRLAARGPEAIEIRTNDGWSLRARVHEPPIAPVGAALLVHGLGARQTLFDRPKGAGLVATLAGRGWRVVTFDLRGHGESVANGAGAKSAYDDLVRHDVAAAFELTRARAGRKRPVVVVGHALGGQVALAAQGAGAIDADGIVAVATTVWLRELETSALRWWMKRGILAARVEARRRVGHVRSLPARVLQDLPSLACLQDIERFARTGAWASADGRDDYLVALGRVSVPVLAVVSDGDRLECAPVCGQLLLARVGGPRDVVRIQRGDDRGPPPGHEGILTSPRSRSVLEQIEAWMRMVPRRRPPVS